MSPLVFRPPSQFSLFPVSACPVRLPPLHHLNFCVCLPALQSNSSPSPSPTSLLPKIQFASFRTATDRVFAAFPESELLPSLPSFQLPFLQSRPVFSVCPPSFFLFLWNLSGHLPHFALVSLYDSNSQIRFCYFHRFLILYSVLIIIFSLFSIFPLWLSHFDLAFSETSLSVIMIDNSQKKVRLESVLKMGELEKHRLRVKREERGRERERDSKRKWQSGSHLCSDWPGHIRPVSSFASNYFHFLWFYSQLCLCLYVSIFRFPF